MTRVLITGARGWNCHKLAERIMARLIAKHGAENLTIVHGDCPSGIDHVFNIAAEAAELDIERFPADWDAYGKGAGPRRNQTMIETNPDMVIALHKNIKWSKGTGDTVRRALAAGIPVWLIDSEDGEPKRLEEI